MYYYYYGKYQKLLCEKQPAYTCRKQWDENAHNPAKMTAANRLQSGNPVLVLMFSAQIRPHDTCVTIVTKRIFKENCTSVDRGDD